MNFRWFRPEIPARWWGAYRGMKRQLRQRRSRMRTLVNPINDAFGWGQRHVARELTSLSPVLLPAVKRRSAMEWA